jgi:hypothetical protein
VLYCLAAVAGVAAMAACGIGSFQGQPVAAPSAAGSSAAPTIPSGVGPSPISSDQAKAFSDCMAQHGAPLPSAGSGPKVGSSPTTDQATIKSALAACKSLMPAGSGGGPSGGGSGGGPGGS